MLPYTFQYLIKEKTCGIYIYIYFFGDPLRILLMPKNTAFEADRLSFIVVDINFMVNPYLIFAIKLRKPSFFASEGHRVGPTQPIL